MLHEVLLPAWHSSEAEDNFFIGPNVSFFFASRRQHTRCLIDWSSDVCSSDLVGRSKGVQLQRGTFVGRELELDALRAAYTCAEETQRPVLVTILGEPGIGKSTLVRAFRRWLPTRSPRPVERVGRCRSFGQASAYSPLAEVVGGEPELVERWPILGVALGQPAPAELHPLEVVQRLREAWVERLEELAAASPLVVLLEDLHWAERELLELLAAVRQIQGPLLLVGTARYEVELNP